MVYYCYRVRHYGGNQGVSDSREQVGCEKALTEMKNLGTRTSEIVGIRRIPEGDLVSDTHPKYSCGCDTCKKTWARKFEVGVTEEGRSELPPGVPWEMECRADDEESAKRQYRERYHVPDEVALKTTLL